MKRLFDRLFARYPLRSRATWAALIAGIGTLTLQFGLDAQLANEIQNVGTGILNLIVLLGFVKTAEAQVTPLTDPRDNAGEPLTPDIRI